MLHEPETWVLVAFVAFIIVLIRLKVPAFVTRMLDDRGVRIAKELDDAQKLRAEAEALLKGYEAKRAEAEKLAADIVAQARSDAVEYAAEARKKLGEQLTRLTQQAEQKIAQAEAGAVKEVRNVVADIAIAAAAKLTPATLKGGKAAGLIDESIAAVKSRLN